MDIFGISGKLEVSLTSENGVPVPVAVTDNGDGTYTCDYRAITPGTHQLNCRFGGMPVTQCPNKIVIQPQVDVSKIRVDGLEPSKS